jgi:carboxypeptidase family protein
VGYWFERGSFPVTAGRRPLEHDVPVIAAGAIRGRILNADGTLAKRMSGINVGVFSVEDPAGGPVAANQVSMANIYMEDADACFISPLPLGGLYRLNVSRLYEIAFSEPIRVDGQNPRPTVEVQFSPARKVVAQVLGPAGQPLADADVFLEIRAPYYSTRYSEPHHADRDGRVALTLSTGMADYWLVVTPGAGFQRTEVGVPPEGTTVEVRPKPAFVIEGRVIDSKTGEPLAGVELVADSTDPKMPSAPWYKQVKPVTDADGRFRFDTLAEGSYRVHPYGAVSFREPVIAHTGDSIVLRARKHAAQKESP